MTPLMSWLFPVLALIASYLVGSIPFSYLVPRVMRGADIRRQGSGNVGATNVLRNFGKLAGAAALLLDMAKGWIAVRLVAQLLTGGGWRGSETLPASFWIAAAAVLAVLGHMFPIWLRFRGGKGVATAAGVFLALSPLALLLGLIVFAIVMLSTRFVSLASIVVAAAMPVIFRFAVGAPFWFVIASVVIALSVIVRHHGNIRRLSLGTERKFPG